MLNLFRKKPKIVDDESKLSDGLLKKPWGSVETLTEDVLSGIEFRRIIVNPGKTTSLHRHLKRREYWFVASGVGSVEISDNPEYARQLHQLVEGQEAVMAQGRWHRLINTSKSKPFIIYELAIGDISEEDIERIEEK